MYRFRDASNRVLYLGRATELRSRVRSYWGDLGDRRHLRAMVRSVVAIEAVPCDSVHEASWLERNLLERGMPRWNRTPGGQESAVSIRMDVRPGSPGLSTVRERDPVTPGLLFGPYLGGLQVRRAISALHRVLPLAYTGLRLPGSAREMALKLGLTAGGDPQLQRAEIATALRGVLEREPVALQRVLDALAAARDRAAGALAFELAARIQEEIHAVEWITSPQRVTVPGGADSDVYGYSDGVLVHFAVVGGRLCRWRQRACAPERAQRLLAGTPEEWRPFAQRAAGLAAALATG